MSRRTPPINFGRTPHERLYNEKPSIKHIRPFSIGAYAHIHAEARQPGSKLLDRAEKGLFVGYGRTTKTSRIYIPQMIAPPAFSLEMDTVDRRLPSSLIPQQRPQPALSALPPPPQRPPAAESGDTPTTRPMTQLSSIEEQQPTLQPLSSRDEEPQSPSRQSRSIMLPPPTSRRTGGSYKLPTESPNRRSTRERKPSEKARQNSEQADTAELNTVDTAEIIDAFAFATILDPDVPRSYDEAMNETNRPL
ncbi:hypothetical protein EJ04DRAFT_600449 [Polyplosphaeria fusca]|uniref:Retroviral polymerase SH3-like domain-containing protein n=1 Tax=Polyplosphaeria fusca TaxID=682080 RepID=A0A9P4R6X3_9PLEO|nr:hypothetical protein EJ04DRAFT_600449 [Polyplosphaeria fusca]